ncbi:MAG: aspartate aminotransferase family protein [Alphaproteobacteria bacterium]|nr:aspartate aminotransferase family protein [Alphaproteobacteria bacterium]
MSATAATSTADNIIPCYGRFPLRFVRGEGAYAYTEDDTPYLDFASGIAVNALGHSDKGLRDALHSQIDKIWHCSNLYHIPQQEELATMLAEKSFADRVFFSNSGLEANEAMIKCARRYHYARGDKNRQVIITLSGAFHGRSLATLAATGNPTYLEGMGPTPQGFKQVARDDVAIVAAAIDDTTAAILVEPVQGEGGLYPLVNNDYLQKLRALADEYGILLLFDEVQCGVARTGKLWAHQHAGITPDGMSLAKGLGGGFPVGAFLATEELGTALSAGTHGNTFGGNYLAMVAAKYVISTVSTPDFLANVVKQGQDLSARLQQLCQRFPDMISDIRGMGLMLGIRLADNYSNKDLVASLHQQQMLSVPAGDNVVRLLPPLNISTDVLDVAEQKISEALGALQ